MPRSAQPARTLADFEPLLLAESIVLRALETDGIARVGYSRPRQPTADVRVRASFLAFLALTTTRRIQVLGAVVVGALDFRQVTVARGLWFYRCVFGATPRLAGARVRGSLEFVDCVLPGLEAEAARVDGDLSLARSQVDGEVQLAHARVDGMLNADRLTLCASPDVAHAAPCRWSGAGLRVEGDLRLTSAEIVGHLCLPRARVGGSLLAAGARVSAPLDEEGRRGVAVDLSQARVGGDLRLDAGFSATGQVRMPRVQVGGDLDVSGAEFDVTGDAGWNQGGATLQLDHARIGGALVLRELKAPLQGVGLADARATVLDDDAGSWGQGHVLDGFRYRRLALTAPADAASRIAWLDAQADTRGGAADAWRWMERVMLRTGSAAVATDVAVARERYLARSGRTGFLHRLSGWLVGYGHRPVRVLVAALVVWAACAAAYGSLDRWTWTGAAPAAADPALPWVRPMVYSAETLVPMAPATGPRWVPQDTTPWLRPLTVTQSVCGWVMLLLLTLCAMVRVRRSSD